MCRGISVQSRGRRDNGLFAHARRGIASVRRVCPGVRLHQAGQDLLRWRPLQTARDLACHGAEKQKQNIRFGRFLPDRSLTPDRRLMSV